MLSEIAVARIGRVYKSRSEKLPLPLGEGWVRAWASVSRVGSEARTRRVNTTPEQTALELKGTNGAREPTPDVASPAIRDRLFRLAYRLLWNHDDAEDAVQNVLAAALTKGGQLRDGDKWWPWIESWFANVIGWAGASPFAEGTKRNTRRCCDPPPKRRVMPTTSRCWSGSSSASSPDGSAKCSSFDILKKCPTTRLPWCFRCHPLPLAYTLRRLGSGCWNSSVKETPMGVAVRGLVRE